MWFQGDQALVVGSSGDNFGAGGICPALSHLVVLHSHRHRVRVSLLEVSIWIQKVHGKRFERDMVLVHVLRASSMGIKHTR